MEQPALRQEFCEILDMMGADYWYRTIKWLSAEEQEALRQAVLARLEVPGFSGDAVLPALAALFPVLAEQVSKGAVA